MPEITNEKAISEYKRLKKKLGHQPGRKEFIDGSSITKRQLEALYGAESYSKPVKAAGEEPALPFHLRPNKVTNEQGLENWGG